jgi:molybdopterin-guanine dinucleotide biosynthesis protein A
VTDSPAVLKDVTGAILVGGRSSRFGGDKVLVSIESRPLIVHLYDLFSPLVPEVLLVGHKRREFEALGLRVVEDVLPDAGPLGGIYTALLSAATPYVFAVAADMPFLSSSVIRTISGARRDADAVIPRGPRGLEPLCAVYARTCSDPIRASLDLGVRRIVTALEGLRILTPDIQAREGEKDPFFNINRPEDLDLLKG